MAYKTEGIVEEILVNYRWIFVLFLLPISFLYDVWTYFRNWYVFKLNTAPKKHSDKVRNVQRQVDQILIEQPVAIYETIIF